MKERRGALSEISAGCFDSAMISLIQSQTSNGANEIVFDVETKKSFDEVGGRNNLAALGVSVLGAYFYRDGSFRAYEEHELSEFEKELEKADRVIGFNIYNFDLPVLQPYMEYVTLATVPALDIFDDVVAKLGHRISLDALAKATLGLQKSGHGLEALQWFREGRIQEVKDYCLQDVALTRDLYEFGKKQGHLLFDSIVDGQRHAVAVEWGKTFSVPLAKILDDAFRNRKRVEISYISSEARGTPDFKNTREVDIYAIGKNEISGYCYLRQALRKFKLDRIQSARILEKSYQLPQDSQATLF
jgi:hypothetical protein